MRLSSSSPQVSIQVSSSARCGVIADSMRGVARREPTFAWHVHVGVPDPEEAIRLLNSLREVVPILIALSANSPFGHGLDTGSAPARTVISQGFPRTGTALRLTQRFAPSGATPVGAADSV
jgi:glutamate---cysteine ligase / carboxylate-amine ligase